MTAAALSYEEAFVIDLGHRLSQPRRSVTESTRARAAARLQQVQRERAKLAAQEAEVILRLAELSPDDDDLPADHPGATKESWRTEPQFPGVSEFFSAELAVLLNV